jgi:hypothetical protein
MVAMGKSLENLTFEFGHSGGAAVLKSHYVGVMSKAEAIKIWEIGPNGFRIPLSTDVDPIRRFPVGQPPQHR